MEGSSLVEKQVQHAEIHLGDLQAMFEANRVETTAKGLEIAAKEINFRSADTEDELFRTVRSIRTFIQTYSKLRYGKSCGVNLFVMMCIAMRIG